MSGTRGDPILLLAASILFPPNPPPPEPYLEASRHGKYVVLREHTVTNVSQPRIIFFISTADLGRGCFQHGLLQAQAELFWCVWIRCCFCLFLSNFSLSKQIKNPSKTKYFKQNKNHWQHCTIKIISRPKSWALPLQYKLTGREMTK